MHLWEFNNYVKGYEDVLARRDEEIVTVAYHVAGFTNSKKKPRSLSYYLNKLRRGRKNIHNDEVDVDKSREIYNTIQKLKKSKSL